MIPKKIHYCWFGRNPKPKLAQKCIKSWKKHCRDYEVIEWNEDNFDIASAPLYVRQVYEAKKWAFVTDYVRLKVVYENGGIYMDTDVELVKPLDDLLSYSGYFGLDSTLDGIYVNSGLGFGAVRGLPLLKELMEDYQNIPFIREDGTLDHTTCPERNAGVFARHGFLQDDKMQILDEDIVILPSEYLDPKSFEDGIIRKTKNTYSIHHFAASWFPEEKQQWKERVWKAEKKHYYRCLPNRILMRLIGEDNYNKLKKILKG